jgi:hypothetical protein
VLDIQTELSKSNLVLVQVLSSILILSFIAVITIFSLEKIPEDHGEIAAYR